MTDQQQISIRTRGHGDMHDRTAEVAATMDTSGIRTGTLTNIGSTAAVGTIEFEPGLKRDLPNILDKLIPPSRDYGHEQAWHDGNGHSHQKATMLAPSLAVPIANRKLVLGAWQQILHLGVRCARPAARGGNLRSDFWNINELETLVTVLPVLLAAHISGVLGGIISPGLVNNSWRRTYARWKANTPNAGDFLGAYVRYQLSYVLQGSLIPPVVKPPISA